MAKLRQPARFKKVIVDTYCYVTDPDAARAKPGYCICDRTLYHDGRPIGLAHGISGITRKPTDEERRQGKVAVCNGPWTIQYTPQVFTVPSR